MMAEHSQQQESTVRNAAVRHEPLELALAQRYEIANDEREEGHYPQSAFERWWQCGDVDADQPVNSGEAAHLHHGAHERGDQRGCALIHIGAPEMERNSCHLEAQSHGNEEEPDEEEHTLLAGVRIGISADDGQVE